MSQTNYDLNLDLLADLDRKWMYNEDYGSITGDTIAAVRSVGTIADAINPVTPIFKAVGAIYRWLYPAHALCDEVIAEANVECPATFTEMEADGTDVGLTVGAHTRGKRIGKRLKTIRGLAEEIKYQFHLVTDTPADEYVCRKWAVEHVKQFDMRVTDFNRLWPEVWMLVVTRSDEELLAARAHAVLAAKRRVRLARR